MASWHQVRVRFFDSAHLRAAAWIMLSFATLSAMAATVKAAGDQYHFFQTVFFRNVGALFWLTPFIVRYGVRTTFSTRRFPVHLRRSLFGVVTMMLYFYGMPRVPLVDQTILDYTKPVFVAVMLWALYGERVTRARGVSMLLCCVGVVMVVKPAAPLSGGMHGAYALYLLAVLMAAVVILQIRDLSRTESKFTTICYFTLIATLITGAVCLGSGKPVVLRQDWDMVLLLGGLGIIGQTAFVRAFYLADTGFVAAMQYTGVIFPLIYGYVLFDEIPDAWSVAGAAVIIASTFWLTSLEARTMRRREKGMANTVTL